MSNTFPRTLNEDQWAIIRDHLACRLQELANGDSTAVPTIELTDAEREEFDLEPDDRIDDFGPKKMGRIHYGRLKPIFAALFPERPDPWI